MANPLDFTGKTVLVVGGTSGIGNGIAHGFREQGAAVYVTGTRASADDYSPEDGSVLEGLTFHSLDVADRAALDAFAWPERLDVVVLCQGIARYNRDEFNREGLRIEVDLRNETINYKVREHSLARIPVLLVVGAREAEQRTVSIRRPRSSDATRRPG